MLLGVLLAVPLFAATETNSAASDSEASYTKAIEGRTADILKALALTDAKKSAAVHDIVIAQYRALQTWHDENDAKFYGWSASDSRVRPRGDSCQFKWHEVQGWRRDIWMDSLS